MNWHKLNIILYVLLNTFDLIIILRFYNKFGECKLKKWVMELLLVLFICFFSSFIEPEILYMNLVNLSCWSALFLAFFHFPSKTKGLIILTQIALAGVCQSLPYFLTKKYGTNSNLKIILAGHLLFFIVMELGGRLYRVHTKSIKGHMWFILLLIPVASFFSIPCVLLLGLNSHLQLARLYGCLIPVFILLIFINLVAFYLFDKLSLLLETAEQNIGLEKQLKYQTAFYRSLEETQEDIRSIKHDMKNNLETVQSLLTQNRTDDARAFVNQITKSIENVEKVIFTNNPPLDTIVNIKINTASKYKIKFQHQVNIPSGLPISYEQATAILGNLLDNAIEAQQYLDEDKRTIEFFMTYGKGILMISIKNPFNREKVDLNMRKTNKKNDKLHGIGLINVKKTVDKMGGILKISPQENFMQVDVLLYF